jgi:hypothetical protein
MVLFLYNPRFSQACCLLHAGFLLGLFFNPQDGGNMFLQIAVDFQWQYNPEHKTSLNHCCENPSVFSSTYSIKQAADCELHGLH